MNIKVNTLNHINSSPLSIVLDSEGPLSVGTTDLISTLTKENNIINKYERIKKHLSDLTMYNEKL